MKLQKELFLQSAALSEVAAFGTRQSLNRKSTLEDHDDLTSPKHMNCATVFTGGQTQNYKHMQPPHNLKKRAALPSEKI